MPTLPELARLALVAGIALAPPAPAAAQVLVGTVTERGTMIPVEGAFVVLVDDAGRRLNGVLSGADGGYTLRAPAPGTYRLLAELIGYATTTSDAVEVAVGPALRHDIQVAVQAVTLDGIQVETGQRCRRRPGSGIETARLWEEARKALEVTRWSGERGVLRFTLVSHTRELDARTLRVLSQTQRPRRGYSDRSPFRSISVERLDAGGFVQASDDGSWDFFAPDADVLLSAEFLDAHCFRVVEPAPDEPELIGLGFEPVPERQLPDVRGVLWLEKGTAELRRLDYSYDNLPFRHDDWSAVGGRVEFERLANGVWIVRRWYIRMPLEARETGGFGGSRTRLELVSLSEQGAEVREVRTAAGRVLAEAMGASLQGVIRSARDDAGIGGATIEIPALDRQATTGPDGAFRLTGLPEGVFEVFIRHPGYRPVAGDAAAPAVELRRGVAARLVAALEPRPVSSPVRRAGVDGPSWTNGLVGRVLDDEGAAALAGAMARLFTPDGLEVGAMMTDDAGRFRLIHPGLGITYVLAVERPGYGAYREEVQLRPGVEYTVQIVLTRR